MRIAGIRAREIFDSRGFPTLEVQVKLENGMSEKASVPSGASTGKYEAREKRDGGKRLLGKGAYAAVENVQRAIAPALLGWDIFDREGIDSAMCRLDGTDELSYLGANAVLGVSMACARAAARARGEALYRYLGYQKGNGFPLPLFNVINGGAHAGNGLDIQEFMLAPVGAANFREAMDMGCEVYHALKGVLKEKGLSTAVGDEGGFAPDITESERALEFMEEAVHRAGFAPGGDISFALDIAASEWARENGTYVMPKCGRHMDSQGVMDMLEALAAAHPIISMEDPLGEDDTKGFAAFRKRMPGMGIVGDDLFVTNRRRIMMGAEEGCATAALIKPNQAGTVSRTMDAIAAARENGMDIIISHRSGETGCSFIADLAWAVGACCIKAGAPVRGERTAKYNRMLEIELTENGLWNV